MSDSALQYQPWVAPSISPGDGASGVSPEEVAEVLEQARREGFEQGRSEGFKQGHTEGFRAGDKDVRQRVQRLEQLHQALSQPLEQIDEDIQRRIVELSLSLARQVVRVELDLRPEQLLPLVREAVAQLAPGRDAPDIHLHPGDAAMLRDLLAQSGEGADWQLVADDRVSAGGCRVHSGFMEVDATLETRLETVTGRLRATLEAEQQS